MADSTYSLLIYRKLNKGRVYVGGAPHQTHSFQIVTEGARRGSPACYNGGREGEDAEHFTPQIWV